MSLNFLKDEKNVNKDGIGFVRKILINAIFLPFVLFCFCFYADFEYKEKYLDYLSISVCVFYAVVFFRAVFMKKPVGFRHFFVFLFFPIWAVWVGETTKWGKKLESEFLILEVIMCGYFFIYGVYKLIRWVPVIINKKNREKRFKKFTQNMDQKVIDYVKEHHPEVLEIVDEENVSGYILKNHSDLHEKITGRKILLKIQGDEK